MWGPRLTHHLTHSANDSGNKRHNDSISSTPPSLRSPPHQAQQLKSFRTAHVQPDEVFTLGAPCSESAVPRHDTLSTETDAARALPSWPPSTGEDLRPTTLRLPPAHGLTRSHNPPPPQHHHIESLCASRSTTTAPREARASPWPQRHGDAKQQHRSEGGGIGQHTRHTPERHQHAGPRRHTCQCAAPHMTRRLVLSC
jgi:hypothetical protein